MVPRPSSAIKRKKHAKGLRTPWPEAWASTKYNAGQWWLSKASQMASSLSTTTRKNLQSPMTPCLTNRNGTGDLRFRVAMEAADVAKAGQARWEGRWGYAVDAPGNTDRADAPSRVVGLDQPSGNSPCAPARPLLRSEGRHRHLRVPQW